MATGFALFAFASWMLSGINRAMGFWELFLPQALRGFAILLCIVPTGRACAERRAAGGTALLLRASSIWMRNLGGAIGIAACDHRG